MEEDKGSSPVEASLARVMAMVYLRFLGYHPLKAGLPSQFLPMVGQAVA